MSSTEHVRRLMSEIGPMMDLKEVIEVDDKDRWILNLDDEFVIVADYVLEDDRLFLTAPVGVPPPAMRETCFELLLAHNAKWHKTGGIRMALEQETRAVLQICDVPVAALNASAFQTVIENFIRRLADWLTIVASATEEPGSMPEELLSGALRA